MTNAFAEVPGRGDHVGQPQDRAVELIKTRPARPPPRSPPSSTSAGGGQPRSSTTCLPRRADQQVGKDYLGGGLADNLYAAAQFNKELGKIDAVQPDSTYEDAVVATFAEQGAEE